MKMASTGKFDFSLLILRLGVGGLLLSSHGLPKLLKFNNMLHEFPDPVGWGGEVSYLLVLFAEFFCSLAVMLGLFTRWATIPIIVGMMIIAFIVHADDPWNKQEFALLFAIPFLTLLISGPGKYSLDHAFYGK